MIAETTASASQVSNSDFSGSALLPEYFVFCLLGCATRSSRSQHGLPLFFSKFCSYTTGQARSHLQHDFSLQRESAIQRRY
jgi:hypothetical protein